MNQRLILAPMQGLTEVLFRCAFEHCFPKGFDLAMSPFISLTHGNLTDALKKISDVLPENNQGCMPVIPQLLGREPDEFISLANRLGELGFDEVNWNIGCPMRRVAGKHRGSGILPYPDEVRAVLDAVMPHIKVGLSVKMRLGYQRDDEILPLIPILNSYPLRSVTVHPRTGRQQYGGSVNLDRFAEVLPQFTCPVIYNGDICTAQQYSALVQRFPSVHAVMIGRGALYNPLLPYQIKGIPTTPADALSFVAHLMRNIEAQPISTEAKIRKTKEYWCLLWHATSVTEQQSRVILHCQEFDTLYQTILSLTR